MFLADYLKNNAGCGLEFTLLLSLLFPAVNKTETVNRSCYLSMSTD